MNQSSVRTSELKKWFDQAEKLGRSNKHLIKIQQVIDQKYNHGFGYVELSPRDYKAMEKDRKDYQQRVKSNSQDIENSPKKPKNSSTKTDKKKDYTKSQTTNNKNQDRDLTHAEKEALYGLISSTNTPYSPRL